MKLIVQLREATTPVARAALFRSALLNLVPPIHPAQIARDCETSGALVSLVLQGKRAGGVKGRAVQDRVAELLHEDPDKLFTDRGPLTKAGGWHAQRRNREQ